MGPNQRRQVLTVVVICLAGVSVLGQGGRVVNQAGSSGWRVDFNGDGTIDSCQIVGTPGYSSLACNVTGSARPVDSGRIDLGYPEGRAFVDFDGDRKSDFCRVVGNSPKQAFLRCTFSEGTAFGTTISSDALDAGTPESRQWRDVNGDGKADFCRVLGTYQPLLNCTFSLGRSGFGKTVVSKRY